VGARGCARAAYGANAQAERGVLSYHAGFGERRALVLGSFLALWHARARVRRALLSWE